MSCQNCNSTCSCAVGAADGSVSVVGNGSGSSPYGVSVQRSSIADNALSVESDGLYISSVSATISGGIIRCTSSTRPPAVDGRIIYESDTRNLLIYTDGIWRGVNSSGSVASVYGSFSATPFAANAASVRTRIFSSQTLTMPVAPYPLRMTVRVAGSIGGNGDTVDPQQHGLHLFSAYTDNTYLSPSNAASTAIWLTGYNYSPLSMFGYKDYAAGEQTSFGLWRTMGDIGGTGANVEATTGPWLNVGIEASFEPLPGV